MITHIHTHFANYMLSMIIKRNKKNQTTATTTTKYSNLDLYISSLISTVKTGLMVRPVVAMGRGRLSPPKCASYLLN